MGWFMEKCRGFERMSKLEKIVIISLIVIVVLLILSDIFP
jgi:cell division protein FtsL